MTITHFASFVILQVGNQEASLKRSKVECLIGIGHYAEAEGLTRRLLSQNPGDSTLIFLRAQVYTINYKQLFSYYVAG